MLDEIVIKAGDVDVLTGNTSLYSCQEVLNDNIYSEILKCAKEKYDFIIFDTSSNIFLDSTKWCLENSTKVMFVIENDYLSLKKCNQFLDVIIKSWGIWKEKINIIINKERSSKLEYGVIEKILDGFNIIGRIKQNGEDDYTQYENILENLNFIPKTRLKDRVIAIINSTKASIEKGMSRKISSEKECVKVVN